MSLQEDEITINRQMQMPKAKDRRHQTHLQNLLVDIKRKQQQAGRKTLQTKVVDEETPS